jgi:N-acetylmuramoyl-L-alanine amidase
MKLNAVLLAALLIASSPTTETSAQVSPLLQKAREAYQSAETLEAELDKKPDTERSRAAYVKAIRAYERVYRITPHTGYADNALMAVARLYEELNDKHAAIRTLTFLIREYPDTPFKGNAEKDIARLQGVAERKTGAVENIRYWEAANSVRVVVDLTGQIAFNQGAAKSPERIFVDISPARLNSMLVGKQWPVKTALLEQIRVGQYDATTVRVVLDVGTVSRVASLMLRDPDRLVIDILGKDPIPLSQSQPGPPVVSSEPALAAAVSPIGTESPNPLNPPAAPRGTTAGKPPSLPLPVPPENRPADIEKKSITPAKAPNAGTRSLIRSLGLKLSRVVIDAGHGGHDTGSVGPNGYTEKELVLDVAFRLKQLIEKELGADVVMTRSDDSFVPLESRTAMANEQGSDLFISIHANSSRVRSVRGVETFFLNFTSSREELETASRENAASDRSVHELQDLVKKIMLRDKVEESRELAEHIQRSMAARKGAGIDRGVKQAPFVVLIGANVPSILAEICFITNPQEERLIKNPQNRQAIAESLYEGVRSYAESLSSLKSPKSTDKGQE